MAKPKKIVVDVKVVIEGKFCWWEVDSIDRKCETMDRWARDLEDFFRDHRSMDVNSIRAEKTYREVCSSCSRPWEVDYDQEKNEKFCAYCGEPIE